MYEAAFALLIFGLGASIGSFLNVVIHRVPLGESIVHPGSRCPKCGWAIPFWANVPVVAWFALRGRCYSCKQPISMRYPVVEALVGCLFVAFWWVDPWLPRLLTQWAMASALVAIAFIDFDHRIVPNAITYPGIPLALVCGFLVPPPDWIAAMPFWLNSLLGFAIGGGLLLAISAYYEWSRGEIGLGRGDVKLVAMLGAYLGLDAIFGVLLLGSILGIAHWVVLRSLHRASRQTRIPFAPALAIAGIVHQFEPSLISRLLAA